MTITQLFTVLPPATLMPLPPALAIDAPCWIVEALQSPSLRQLHSCPISNLFFVRTHALLCKRIAPTFVFDSTTSAGFSRHQASAQRVAEALGCRCLTSQGTAESLCVSLEVRQTPTPEHTPLDVFVL